MYQATEFTLLQRVEMETSEAGSSGDERPPSVGLGPETGLRTSRRGSGPEHSRRPTGLTLASRTEKRPKINALDPEPAAGSR